MTRKAILIKGFSKSTQELKDDMLFIHYYERFLKSKAGGAWKKSEIIIIQDPTVRDLKEIAKNISCDYVLTVLIGHGAIKDDYQIFKVNSKETIKPGQLIFNAPKQLILVESC